MLWNPPVQIVIVNFPGKLDWISRRWRYYDVYILLLWIYEHNNSGILYYWKITHHNLPPFGIWTIGTQVNLGLENIKISLLLDLWLNVLSGFIFIQRGRNDWWGGGELRRRYKMFLEWQEVRGGDMRSTNILVIWVKIRFLYVLHCQVRAPLTDNVSIPVSLEG